MRHDRRVIHCNSSRRSLSSNKNKVFLVVEVSFSLVFKVIFAAWNPFHRWSTWMKSRRGWSKVVIVYTKFIMILDRIYRMLPNNNDLDGLIGSDTHLSTIRWRRFTSVTFHIESMLCRRIFFFLNFQNSSIPETKLTSVPRNWSSLMDILMDRRRCVDIRVAICKWTILLITGFVYNVSIRQNKYFYLDLFICFPI